MKFNYSIVLSVATLLCSRVNAHLSESDKDSLLRLHRSTRESVGASNMNSISWDNDLAKAAQSYADGCHGMHHSGPRENLAENGGSSSIETLFGQWKKEKSAFLESGYASDFKDVKYDGNDVGHYSQIVWAKNTKVGCGKANCNGKAYLVCRYGEGNITHQKVYEGGSDSSKKTTTKKVITTTVKKTTTTTIAKPVNAPTTKAPVQPVNNGAKAIATKGLSQGVLGATPSVKLPLATGALTGAIPTAANGSAAAPIAGANGVNGANNANGANGANATNGTNGDKDNVHIVSNSTEEDSSSTGTIVTGVALSGTVIGAAAAFVLVKKNPKQYENLKRNLTRKATSVKRGASVVTRKLTTKKTSTPLPQSNAEDYENGSNYRAEFTDAMKV